MKLRTTVLATGFVLLLGAATLPGCKKAGPLEKAGEAVDQAVDDASDAIEDAGDAIEDAADDLKDAVDPDQK